MSVRAMRFSRKEVTMKTEERLGQSFADVRQ